MLTSDETNQISKDQKNLGGKYVYKIRVNFTQPSVSLKQRNIGSAIDRQQNWFYAHTHITSALWDENFITCTFGDILRSLRSVSDKNYEKKQVLGAKKYPI